jgi:hypothetical protein
VQEQELTNNIISTSKKTGYGHFVGDLKGETQDVETGEWFTDNIIDKT